MSESRPDNPGPTVIAGRYQILRKLGAGAFGTVYMAKDTTLGRELAIKTIRLEGLAAASTDLDELLKRFKQEATAGAALKHPNIVTVYDFGQSEGQAYLAMEYVEGVGLDRIIAEAGKLPIDRAAGLAAQVADALGYAHRKKVIHRDIKPANIMVEAGERVKVTDFGIARVMDSGENLTQTGGLLGTPSYMSPEQAKGKKVDGRSDLFSVGCVLYELLAGRKAFGGDTITGILFKIIAEEPTPIRDVDPLIPDDIVRIVDKALAKDPDERYQTGRDLAEDLLMLAQPGHVPTLRQADVPTAHGAAQTIVTPPTAQGSISSVPTAARAAASTTPGAGATAPVAPTQLMGETAPSAPPPVAAAPAPRRPTPATPGRSARAPQRRGMGRVVAIGAAAALLLVAGAMVAWMVLGRGGPGPTASSDAAQVAAGTIPDPGAAATQGPGAPPSTAAPRASAAPATPPPAPVVTRPPQTTAPGAPPPATARQAATREVTRDAPPQAAPSGPAQTAATAATPSAALPPQSDDSFLDDLPAAAAPDGRAAGQALAQAYGSGDAPAYGSGSRFRRRPAIPSHGPAEQPAVRTLAWILSAEKAHIRRTGRYGTLEELIAAGDFPLTGPRRADGFDRRQYRFAITASGEEFRADATPLSPRGRAFYVDENGYVLEADD